MTGTAAAAGIAIGALFALIKHETLREEYQRRAVMTRYMDAQRAATQEAIARQGNLERMRQMTQSQLGMTMAERGVPYGFYGGAGGGGAPMAAYVARSGGV
jgi:hypothetical protein